MIYLEKEEKSYIITEFCFFTSTNAYYLFHHRYECFSSSPNFSNFINNLL